MFHSLKYDVPIWTKSFAKFVSRKSQSFKLKAKEPFQPKAAEDKNFREQIVWFPITKPYSKELRISGGGRERLHVICLEAFSKGRSLKDFWAFSTPLLYFVLKLVLRCPFCRENESQAPENFLNSKKIVFLLYVRI